MCGIVGLLTHTAGSAVDPVELTRIRDHMADRGPDGAGAWRSPDGVVSLGHRRLSIIGPGSQGAQPMVLDYCRRSAVITYNGEIFNHHELRRSLVGKGHSFRSTCDTEVVLHLYEEYGDQLVHHVRGMYALGIWDVVEQRLFLARDPFGVKPLYYAPGNGVFRFASQARALLAGGAVPVAVDDAALAGFFLLGSVPEPRTAWTSIRSLGAGSTMTVDLSGAIDERTFYSASDELRRADNKPSDRNIADAVAESVRAHLVADVEVGAFLSAGVDSGAILGIASEENEAVAAVTLGFEEFRGTEADETLLAGVVARHYGAEHSVATISGVDCEAALPRFFASMDQPSIDGLNTWFVSRIAREAGLKVALSGLGGDELMGGYSSFTSVPKLRRWLRAFAAVPNLGPVARTALRAALPSSVNPKVASTLEYAKSLELMWFLRRAVFLPWELPALMGEERAHAALAALRLEESVLRAATHPDPGTDVGRVAALESGIYMRNQLLRDADWASMAHSVEVRVPLVDAQLYRYAAHRFKSWSPAVAKSPLAMAPRSPLPREVLERTKTGFGLPMQAWVTASRRADHWREVPGLASERCPWSRRWAYVVAAELDLVGPR